MSAILEVSDLAKHFLHPWTRRRLCAIDGLEMCVREGEIYGLIGPNGAGKTTTFKLLLGMLRPHRGSVTFQGRPIDTEARAGIGFLPEQPYFYDHLTVEETLDFYARLYGLTASQRGLRVAALLERLQLLPKRRVPLRTLSKGTLQRVGIAQAIVNRPRLLILDEPLSGLDPVGRRAMRELILELQEHGTTVVLSSHILSDAEMLCRRVGILVGGRLREVLDLSKDSATEEYVLTVSATTEATLRKIGRIAGRPPYRSGDCWQVRLARRSAVGAAIDAVREDGGTVESLNPFHPTLEERFIARVGPLAGLD